MSVAMAAPQSSQSSAHSGPTPVPRVARLTHYDRLGLHPSASMLEIRRQYRELSKQYHPDTTPLPAAIATEKFHQLNEAYAILSNTERRARYDLQIGYARIPTVRSQRTPQSYRSNSAYLDPIDRPLSPGELFALLILGGSLVLCLGLAVAIALWRGDPLF